MKRNILTYIIPLAAAFAALTGCATDNTGGVGDKSDEAVSLKGIVSRAGTAGEMDLFVMAFNDDNTAVYFRPSKVRSAKVLNNTNPENFTFVDGTQYYPLGGREINLFGFSGEITDDYLMKIEAGTDSLKYDYVLSNYGSRKSENGAVNDGYEGAGTPGSSADPAHILQFRHVMTQLTIEVEVDQDEDNPVDPAPTKVELEIPGMYRFGRYSIMSVTPDENGPDPVDVADNYGNDLYKAKLGVNYLVPMGLNLVKRKFSSLVIDNYKATADDLSQFEISGSNGETEMYLYPGYAYKLKIIIQRLQVAGIELEQVEWNPVPVGSGEATYDPNQLKLDITGGYANSGDDKIVKMVLHSDERQYVGEADDADGLINYVTLPKQAIDSVDIYTARGYLLTMYPGAGDYDIGTGTLTLELSDVGMILENPGLPNAEDNRYLVTTLTQFLNIKKDLAGYYLQMANIELEEPGVNISGFTGFGSFYGRYEGNDFWIGNVNMTAPGLFAENHGELINIRIYTGNINLTGTYAGSICGVNYKLIYACINEGALFNAPSTVGGICGLNESTGRILACLNTGNIRAGSVIGGICGENRNASERAIAACINIGHIFGASSTTGGGIIGRSVNSPNNVIATSFWLDGSAGDVGETEVAVGQGTVQMDDVTYLDPKKMRNGLDEGEIDPDDRVVTRLNNEINGLSNVPSGYIYVYDDPGEVVTGITWPMPFDTNQL